MYQMTSPGTERQTSGDEECNGACLNTLQYPQRTKGNVRKYRSCIPRHTHVDSTESKDGSQSSK